MSLELRKRGSATEVITEGDNLNIYGRGSLSAENTLEIRNDQRALFANHFRGLGYIEQPPVLISSGIDPSVRFIGSHISVLKPYLVNKNVPAQGVFMVQDCVRTRNVDRLFDDAYNPKWGSFFTSYGCITPASSLGDLCRHTYDFFNKSLNIKPEFMRIRANSQDIDLLVATQKYWPKEAFEIDTQKESYYRHKIGDDHIKGRNVNIALKDINTNEFVDVGNIIVLETEDHKIAAELALGETTILKQLYKMDHVLDCHPVVGLSDRQDAYSRKMTDAILIGTTLLNEGLKPGSSENKSRILRTYLRSLSYFRAKLNIGMEKLGLMISEFSDREFRESSNPTQFIIDYLTKFEADLMSKNKFTPEEEPIRKALDEIK